MTKISIIFCYLLTGLLFDLKAQILDGQLKKLSDAATDSIVYQADASAPISYKEALQKWKTVSDVNLWMKENFHYDMERAKQLSENSSKREKTAIYSPAEFYQIKKGTCVDLSRFAVETINRLDTSKHVQYLMIEFEPIIIDSSIMKKHWVAVYQDSSNYYFWADSKRPGHTAGPYKMIDEFIADYQDFRDRKIVSWKILSSYEKKKKQKIMQKKLK